MSNEGGRDLNSVRDSKSYVSKSRAIEVLSKSRLPEHREIVGNRNSLLPQWRPSLGNAISLDLQCINSVNQVPLTRGKMPRLRCLVWGRDNHTLGGRGACDTSTYCGKRPFPEFLFGQVFHTGGNVPNVTLAIFYASGAVTVELGFGVARWTLRQLSAHGSMPCRHPPCTRITYRA